MVKARRMAICWHAITASQPEILLTGLVALFAPIPSLSFCFSVLERIAKNHDNCWKVVVVGLFFTGESDGYLITNAKDGRVVLFRSLFIWRNHSKRATKIL